MLTKSKYMAGLKCPKYLWMMFHDLDKIPEFDLATKFIMNQGNIVGSLAKQLFPGGINLPEGPNTFLDNIKSTKILVNKKKTIFEAGFLPGDIYARADIILPVEDQWDIIEVKSSTKVKEDHLHDLSFQRYVYETAGLSIRKCFLMHINNQFVKNGEIDVNKFFTKEEVTSEVNAITGVKEKIDEMLKIVNSQECPNITLGGECKNCGICYDFLPEGHVFELYMDNKKSLELLDAEVILLKDIPDEFKLTEKQDIQRKCANSGEIHIDKEGLNKFLSKLEEPIHYLDFETFQTAIPIYEGTKPYQQIPFQFSLHIEDKHFEFLHNSKEDPRKPFLEKLKQSIQGKGSILVYNQSFEIGRLKELAEEFPEEKEWIDSVIKRIVDLIIPFRNFYYYNPKQKGSCSLKAVLPAVTGKDYSHLNIAEGNLAAVSYYEMIFDNGENVKEDLLKYCKLDTEGMVWIVEELKKIITS